LKTEYFRHTDPEDVLIVPSYLKNWIIF